VAITGFTTPPGSGQAGAGGRPCSRQGRSEIRRNPALFPIPSLTMHSSCRADSGITDFAGMEGAIPARKGTGQLEGGSTSSLFGLERPRLKTCLKSSSAPMPFPALKTARSTGCDCRFHGRLRMSFEAAASADVLCGVTERRPIRRDQALEAA